MSQEPADEPLFTGFSEFGMALTEFVRAEPSARGAILSDDDGDPVDYAHHPGAVTPLDLQIVGAQVEQSTARTSAWCARHGLGACEILIEASHGLLLSAMPGHGCVLSSLHDPPGPVDPDPHAGEPADEPMALLARFAAVRRRVAALLS